MFLQNRGYEVLGTHLREQALGLLALRLDEVVRILTGVAVVVLAANKGYRQNA